MFRRLKTVPKISLAVLSLSSRRLGGFEAPFVTAPPPAPVDEDSGRSVGSQVRA